MSGKVISNPITKGFGLVRRIDRENIYQEGTLRNVDKTAPSPTV
jgi:hypothetical protein